MQRGQYQPADRNIMRLILIAISAIGSYMLWQSLGPWSVVNVIALFPLGIWATAAKGSRWVPISLFAIGTLALAAIFNPWAVLAIPIPWLLVLSLMPATKNEGKTEVTKSGNGRQLPVNASEHAKDKQHETPVLSNSTLKKTSGRRTNPSPVPQPSVYSTGIWSRASYERAKPRFNADEIPEGRYARQFFWEKVHGFIGREWRSH